MALHRFTQNIRPYETWGEVDLDPRLRRAVLWSGVATSITLAALLNLAAIWQWSHADFFLVLQTQLQTLLLLCWRMQQPLVLFNLSSLVVYVLLLAMTRRLQSGHIWSHRIAYAQTLIGALNTLILILSMAVIIVNIVVWILAFIIVICVLASMAQG